MSIFTFIDDVKKDTKKKTKNVFKFLGDTAKGFTDVANSTGNTVGSFINKDGKFLGRLDDFVPGFKETTDKFAQRGGASVGDFVKGIASTGVQNSPIGAVDRTIARANASLSGRPSNTLFGTEGNATQLPIQQQLGEADGLLNKGLTAAGILGDVLGGKEIGDIAKVGAKGAAAKTAQLNTHLGQAGYIAGNKAKSFEDALKENAVSKGVDGKLKFEVDDSAATFNPENVKRGQGTLPQILDHPYLYEDYPQLNGMNVKFSELGEKMNGFLDRNTNTIVLNKARDPEKQFETLLHETQHAIQTIEGHASGGSPEALSSMAASANAKPFDIYRALAGESEARNVAGRRSMTQAEREATPFNSTYDVPTDKQIVHYDEGVPASISREDFEKALTPETPKPQPKMATERLDEKTQSLLDGITVKPPTQEVIKKGGKTPEEIIREVPDPKAKANILDVFRTPEKVLNRMGLGEEARLLRAGYEQYAQDLPKELDKIGTWHKQLSPAENKNVFQALDGKEVTLSAKEQKIVGEMKSYLSEWADKLNLPEDARISSYITHIWDDGKSPEFDADLARIIEDKVPGSVYDPFVQKRLGEKGYKEDVIEALDAYVKRATRKINMDPALAKFEKASDGLEQSQYKYVKGYLDRVNMRPTDIDLMLDNWIKQLPGGSKLGARPTNQITGAVRRMVYRGTLGLNVGSAMKNLTQGANTYAKLGERYTIVGYSKLLKAMASRDSELDDVGVMTSRFINDRSVSAKQKVGEKLDKGLFSIFDLAERINRGSAYYGAKSKALKKGASEEQAIETAKAFVRDTQFNFSTVDTPPILSSDVSKTLGQLQSFNIKQAEFLGGMAKGAAKGNLKDIAGLARWTAASLVMVNTVGRALGMSPKDLIPFSGFLSGDNKIGETPATKLPIEIGKAVVGAPDKYGNQPKDTGERLAPIFKATVPFIPAGSQLKKSLQGLDAYGQGESTTATGRTRFDVEQTPSEMARAALLGQYGTSGGSTYVQELRGNTQTTKKTGARGSGSRKKSTGGRGK